MKMFFERYMPLFGADGDSGAAAAAPASGSSSAPASAPSATPESGGGTLDHGDSNSGDSESFAIPDFDDDNLDSIDLSEPVAAAETKRGGEAAPVAEKTNEPVSAQPAPTPAVAAAPAPVAASAAPAAAEESVSLENVDKLFAETGEDLINLWAQNFALTDAETEKLTTNPEEVLPRLLAKAVLHAARSVPNQIKQFVPEMIKTHLAQTERSTKAQEAFFGKWPGLREHSAAVVNALTAAKQQFPNATRTQLIDLGGRMTAAMLGLDPNTLMGTQASAAVPNGQKPGVAPAAPQRIVAPPFRPAGAGGAANGTGGLQPHAGDDPWAGFDLPNIGN